MATAPPARPKPCRTSASDRQVTSPTTGKPKEANTAFVSCSFMAGFSWTGFGKADGLSVSFAAKD